ncbi:microviridin/marinostatin family tricyclic proteinase inhibitor [Komarekiella sp. 'clone 1']|uniref:Microviridin/marinostatin family tricyclic proteinase inhibitor n=1 Tax=Komarekiella delphini-convector SJRDD-AB1 TaxID=2593771 RepID=A0AA40SV80_9NOST|nr:microviridin/marinostatin family tricyclic proteinase inhibitor [Komarekiella delphini-convector SJRDD-AB1]
MSNIKVEDLDSQAVPFFARFLEGQSPEEMSEEEMEAVAGGCGGTVTTLKFPSDNEDVVTKKYPSDSDEYAVTQKYPSDGDDTF